MKWLAIPAIAVVTLVANAGLLDDFWQLAQENALAVAGSDIATHYLRVLHARDHYLPSGHHFGWDPWWFQGYVPFLLYPHLTYVLLALLGALLPIDLERLFNLYILAIYFALPIGAGIYALKPLGALPAIVLTAWLAVLSTTGAGLSAVFVVGLLSQQAGVVLFTFFVIDLVVRRRFDRAAIWLGLILLVHVHASLVAGLVWIVAGAAAVAEPQERDRALRSWLAGSAFAALMAAPTLLGLWHGRGDIGAATGYPAVEGLAASLLSGTFLAPQPTLLALALCFVTTLAVVPAGARTRFRLWWCSLALLLFALSARKWSVGMETADRLFGTMLYLRTLPFFFVWSAVVAVCFWRRFPPALQVGVAVLSLAGVILPRHHEAAVTASIGDFQRDTGNYTARSVRDYRNALKWIATDLGEGTATLALSVPKPQPRWLAEALDICRQPLLGGHGIELTAINNESVLIQTLALDCESIRARIEDYSIGYLAGTDAERRDKLESCLRREAAFTQGDWWVVATGRRWGLLSRASAFEHDATWTTLDWKLRPLERSGPLRLPMAMNSQWLAEVDGEPAAIEATHDGMMKVALPSGGKRLRLTYQGYPGEWWSVVLSICALATAAGYARRTDALARRERPAREERIPVPVAARTSLAPQEPTG